MLLRLLLGLTAAWQSMAYLGTSTGPSSFPSSAAMLSAVGGALLLAGVVTPAASAFAAAGMLVIDASADALMAGRLPLDHVGTSCMVIVALSVLLLGPGAFSIDAWWFGRREIVFPDPPSARD